MNECSQTTSIRRRNTPLSVWLRVSYSEFEFGNPQLEKSTIGADESTVVRVEVINRGSRTADETVQLYVRDVVSSVTHPIKELKASERITLRPGESKTVSLPITRDRLAFWNIDMQRVVEPGEFLIMVGPDSQHLQTATLTVR